MKIVFVNRFFHPDLAPTGRHASDVAFALSVAGHKVHALTSRLSYDGTRRYPARERPRGVRVKRVWTTSFGRGTLAGRALDYLTFYLSTFVNLVYLLNKGDIVVAKTDPPLLGVIAGIAAAVKGAKLVNWLQDIFPEAAARSGMRLLAGPLGCAPAIARDWSVRRAAANVVLGERMAAELARLVPGTKPVVIANWADGDAIRPRATEASVLRREWGLEGKFVVGYSGNLGRVHEVDTVIEAARLLRGDTDVAFSFTGGGFWYERLEKENLPNLSLRGYVPEERLSDSLGACDVHLVTLLPALEGLVVPSKFYGVAAAGRPAIFVGDPEGEIARVIRTEKCGVVVRAGEAGALAAAIRGLKADAAGRQAMGERARALFERSYDRAVGVARWRAMLEAL